MGNVRYDIEYRGEEVGNVKVPWEHGDHVSVEDYEDLTKQLADLREALVYYRDECSGREPSISVFQRMLDEALAALPQEDV